MVVWLPCFVLVLAAMSLKFAASEVDDGVGDKFALAWEDVVVEKSTLLFPPTLGARMWTISADDCFLARTSAHVTPAMSAAAATTAATTSTAKGIWLMICFVDVSSPDIRASSIALMVAFLSSSDMRKMNPPSDGESPSMLLTTASTISRCSSSGSYAYSRASEEGAGVDMRSRSAFSVVSMAQSLAE